MSIFSSMYDFVSDVADTVCAVACTAGYLAEDLAGSAVDTVKKHPGKTALICVGTVATGGAATAFTGSIAAVVGSTGVLGTTASGTAISTLSGVALTNASMAALGGGAIAAGGGGMAAGATVVITTGTVTGAAVSTGSAVVAAKHEKRGAV